MAEQPEHIFVDGIVAARNKEPYVVISTEHGIVVQLDLQAARSVANDIIKASHNAEADAMIFRFFAKHDLPEAAVAAMMEDFRGFRASHDSPEDQARNRPPLGDKDES